MGASAGLFPKIKQTFQVNVCVFLYSAKYSKEQLKKLITGNATMID